MQPGAFDFSLEPADVTLVSPTGSPMPPVNGLTPLSRHASYTGAVKAQDHRSANLDRLRALWVDPWTMQEIALITCLPLSSVCSLKACLEGELEAHDLVTVEWVSGEQVKTTKRTRWRLRTSRGNPSTLESVDTL